jgi:adenosylhomocysteine nucleosidase
MNNKEILIVCALEQETQEELNDWLPFTDNPVWNVLYTGVGKVNATRKLTERFSSYQSIPAVRRNHELVINYGTAGSRELPIGELVDCTKFIQRDMNAVQFGFMKGQTPFENDVPLILDSTHIEFNPIQKHQVCGTGDNFVDNIEDEHSMIDVFDMEAYALAKVCHHYDIPFISFKYITDNADEHSAGDWVDNCSDGVREFKEKVLDLIEKN